MVRMFGFLWLLAFSLPAFAQPLLPVTYDEQMPTLESVLGHDSGAEITTPTEALTYLRTLQAAAPGKMEIVSYATSWEGRELVYAIIASEETMGRLAAVKSDLAQLASGDVGAGQRDEIIARTPGVVWLAYGVHGDEISSTEYDCDYRSDAKPRWAQSVCELVRGRAGTCAAR